jgi:hypothetical protein
MTTPVERTRALLWAGGFLIEVARNKTLPLDVRRAAVVIARHFPTIEDVSSMSVTPMGRFPGPMLASPSEVPAETELGKFGPLLYSTRLGWPEER